MEKKIIRIVILWVLTLILSVTTMAEGLPKVTLRIDGQEQVITTSKQIKVQVDVEFSDQALVNDKLAVSYHVYDSENQMLVMEGQRFYLGDIGAKTVVENLPIAFDLGSLPELKDKKLINVVFDVVDEKNAYWFSTAANISFDTAKIVYDNSFKQKMYAAAHNLFEHPIIMALNILIYVAVLTMLFKVRKNRKNAKKKE